METLEIFSEIRPYSIAVHAISGTAGFCFAMISDIIFARSARDGVLSKPELNRISWLSRAVWLSILFIVVSGVAVFLSNPGVYMQSSKFLAKMSVVAVLIANGFVLYKFVQPKLEITDFLTSDKEKQTRKLAYACGAVSVVSWVFAFSLAWVGSLPVSYPAIMLFYAAVLVVGSTTALMLESKHAQVR